MASFFSKLGPKALTTIAGAAGAAAAAIGFAASTNTAENRWSQVKKAYTRFPAVSDFPDLSKHNNCMANHLTPKMYSKLREKVRGTRATGQGSRGGGVGPLITNAWC